MATDYDAPRKTDDELSEDSIEELKNRRVDKRASSVDVDETELDPTELDIEELPSGVLDVREVAREQVALLAPMHVLCSESCAGLCPTCGGDLNVTTCGCESEQIDPRWEALKRLQNS